MHRGHKKSAAWRDMVVCNRCGKKSLPHGDGYRCTLCACTGKKFRFKVCTVCTDGTAEGEFMLFGDIGEQVVGNQVGATLRTEKQGVDLPPDIAAVVAKKFTWNVSLTEKSFYRKKKSFQVDSIDVCFGRQTVIPRLNPQAGASTMPLAILPATPAGKDIGQTSKAQDLTPSTAKEAPPTHQDGPKDDEHTPPPVNEFTPLAATKTNQSVKTETVSSSSIRKRLFTDSSSDSEATGKDDVALATKDVLPKKASALKKASIPPMRFTDDVCDSASPLETLQIFSVKVIDVDKGVSWPLHVYGKVAARDTVDRHRNMIFDRERDNCQIIHEDSPYLALTGPSRAVVLSVHHSFIEVELKIKRDSDDEEFSYLSAAYIEIVPSRSFIMQRNLKSRLSTLQLTVGYIIKSVEATITVKVSSGKWPCGYGGLFTASTASIYDTG